MTTILLGPQRFMTTAGAALDSLAVEGPVATITAGWEEREDLDDELDGVLHGRGRNLRLYHRMVDVIEKDEAFREQAIELRDHLDELHAFYGLRVRAAMDGVHLVQQRTSVHGIGDEALEAAIDSLRAVDTWYDGAVTELYRGFDAVNPTLSSGVIGWHRGEIAAAMAECAALVITGGHVGTLLRALRLFSLQIPQDLPVIAWSAGAMAITSRVVLFHDFAPHGVSEAEIYDRGLGRLPSIVTLPHARRRLRLDDRDRAGILAKRFAAYSCLLLDDGMTLRFEGRGEPPLPVGARVLGVDGLVHEVAAA